MVIRERCVARALALGVAATVCVHWDALAQQAGQGPVAGAQTNAVAAPQAGRMVGPPVAAPPPYARFLVRFEWADPKAMKPEEGKPPLQLGVRSIEYLKGPRVGRSIITYDNGDTKLTWWYNRIMLERYSGVPDILLTDAPTGGRDGRAADDFDMNSVWLTKYPGFEWVRADHYVGQELKNGAMCLHYVKSPERHRRRFRLNAEYDAEGREIPRAPGAVAGVITNAAGQVVPDEVDLTSELPKNEAWVTLEGRWPVAVRLGDVLRTYQHLEPPTAQSFPRMDAEMEKNLVAYCKAGGLPEPKY
ncbi:MAG: hypothetical protein IT577_21085 [Verrucomicrobiae bacterium]|nr:hypothetical protein [Verrucomicrobiae bacterium]